ncbi:hypothetical protein MNBD_GAMMA11-418 [hydrothermal vent metagenome]|uniref:Co-chaperone DjlA N-terminal domain-containing protein n=1 Tax=hydrothermal vent metagenome TaxID=652676 RepID=A0A3B0XX66_9ZZZZ
MLKKIQLFFEKYVIQEQTGGESVEHSLNLAAAALLVEMIFQDDEIHENEVKAVKALMIEQLGLSSQEAENLYLLAQQERQQATDYHQFTQLIARHYTQQQKIKLIESLWRVAFADHVLDRYEEHMVRRISDLIHVSHKDFIQAKHRVQKSL